MRADARRAEDALALPLEPLARRLDVFHLVADVVLAAGGVLGEEAVDGGAFVVRLDQLDLRPSSGGDDIRVHFGGPVEAGRGFVLHSSDYRQEATMVIDEQIALTATTDILRDIAEGDGPKSSLLALGYSGWGPGQLDAEIQANGWLSVDADPGLIFGYDPEKVWQRALAKIGIDVSMLSGDAGHA